MKEHLNKREIIEKLTPVVENTAMRYGLIPLEISLEKESGHWFLRIFIYHPEHPVSHEDCVNITRGLGDYLDELIPFKYYLEISSPGVDRKLKSEREYVIFKGKDVVVKLKTPVNGEYYIEGVLSDYQKGVGLKISSEGDDHTIELSNLASISLRDL